MQKLTAKGMDLLLNPATRHIIVIAYIAAIGLFLIYQGLELGAPSLQIVRNFMAKSATHASVAGVTSLASIQFNGVLLQLGGSACMIVAGLLALKR